LTPHAQLGKISLMLRASVCYLLLAACAACAVKAGDAKPAKTAPAAPPVEPPAPKEFPRAEALVSTAALAEEMHQAAARLVLLDARSRAAFEAGHLPGACSLESDTLQDPQRPPCFMPAPEVLKKTFAEAGIHAASRVVYPDEEAIAPRRKELSEIVFKDKYGNK
jgi:rhodanese-related sulfurtransferase